MNIENKCSVSWCNCVQNKSGKGYCRRHYDQIRKYGHTLDKRGKRDPSRIEFHDDYAEVIICSADDEELCRAMIDLNDVSLISEYRWTRNSNGYIRSYEGTRPLYIHRLITLCPDGFDVDHINRNKLDNRRCNLRVVSHSANCSNRGTRGCVRKITDRALSKPYASSITINNHANHLGYYATEKEAKDAITRFLQSI